MAAAPVAPRVLEAYEQCRIITKREAKNFYYGFIALPPDKRWAIYAAYAFCRQCDDAVDEAGTLDEKVARLDEMRHRLQECYYGTPDELVLIALKDAATRYSIPRAYFAALIDGMEMDVRQQRYATFEDLRTYCYRAASVIGLICIEIFGYQDPRAKIFATDLGIAMQLTNILRDVREDAERGRIYLPLDEVARFGCTEEQILRCEDSEPLRNLFHFQAERARKYFTSGVRLLPLLSPRSRMCTAVLQGIYTEILNRILAADCDVLSRRISLSNGEKLSLMLRLWIWSALGGLARWPGVQP
jgi:phytoene synthase